MYLGDLMDDVSVGIEPTKLFRISPSELGYLEARVEERFRVGSHLHHAAHAELVMARIGPCDASDDLVTAWVLGSGEINTGGHHIDYVSELMAYSAL